MKNVPFDANGLAQSRLPFIANGVNSCRQKGMSDRYNEEVMDKEWVAKSVGYVPDGNGGVPVDEGGRRIYKPRGSNSELVAIRAYPNDKLWQRFLDEWFFRHVFMNPRFVWVGAAARFASGIGGGNSASGS